MTSNDPLMPLVATGTYFHQTGERKWHPVYADKLTAMLDSLRPPEYRTILSVCGDVSNEDQRETWQYLGPFYADFDATSIEEGIAAFRLFLAKLEAMGIDLNSVRLFATGGRGFHVEIPMETFMAPISPEGVPKLPYIYNEMALALYVDCLDLRVYSARKGRMWRVPNRCRSNGLFKVALTTDEALNMMPERYTELCSAPREFPPLSPPCFCPEMALLYSLAKDKQAKETPSSSNRRAPSAKVKAELVRRFGGKLPPSVAALGEGLFPARGGWNRVAMQLAIVAHAVGMNEDALIDACAGLIEKHVSDGRYNTPARRRDEFRNQYDYAGNYEFSVGGIRSILPQGLRTNDFRGL